MIPAASSGVFRRFLALKIVIYAASGGEFNPQGSFLLLKIDKYIWKFHFLN
jgi:hypothetical protein